MEIEGCKFAIKNPGFFVPVESGFYALSTPAAESLSLSADVRPVTLVTGSPSDLGLSA